jgi:hypothetical protein
VPVAGLDSVVVEIEFTSGTWTDVSTYVRWSNSARARFGRPSKFGQTSAATLDLDLRNEDGRFTPDNPTSPYWPNILEGRRIRVTGVRSSTTYRFFTGYVVSWTPDFPARDAYAAAVVSVSAVDILGQLDRHVLGPQYLESALGLARTASTWVDAFAFDDDVLAVQLRNAGATGGTSTTLGTATLLPTSTGRGSAAVDSSDAALDLPGLLTFTPSGTAGPVLRVAPQASGVQRVDMWLRFPVTTLPAPGIPLRVMDAWFSQTTRVCSLALVNNAGTVELRTLDDSGVNLGTVATGVTDGVWRKVTLAANATTPSTLDVLVNDVTVLTGLAATDLRTVWRFYFGGSVPSPLAEGKQSACTGMDLAGLVITPGTSSPAAGLALPTASLPSTTRFAELAGYASAYYTGPAVEGADDRQVWRTSTTGRTLLDCLQELALTVGGCVWGTPGGTLKLYLADMIGGTTPIATIDIEKDADTLSASPQWAREVDSIPTRVTVSSPAGSTTVINATAEGRGLRRDEQVTSCSPSLIDAASLGAAVLNASPSLRLARFAVDFVNSVNDLWALLVAGSAAPVVRGYTEADNYAAGTTNVPLPAGTVAGDLGILHVHNDRSSGFVAPTGWTTLIGNNEHTMYKILDAADITNGRITFTAGNVFYIGGRFHVLTVIKTGTFNPAAPVPAQYTGGNLAATPTNGASDNVFPTPYLAATAYSFMMWTAYLANTSPISVAASTGSKAVMQQTWTIASATQGALAYSTWGFTGSAGAQDISYSWPSGTSTTIRENRTMVSGTTDVVTLRPGVRLRVTGLPSTTFGYTYTDVIVEGWTLDLDEKSCVLTFDTTPADDPAPGVVGDAEYGRAGADSMTATGGTALTTTTTGTLVLTTAAGKPALTVDSTAYPLDLNLDGERVTVAAAPASSTSPQTVTVTARGVAPTVARAHASGASVDIWHAAQATF